MPTTGSATEADPTRAGMTSSWELQVWVQGGELRSSAAHALTELSLQPAPFSYIFFLSDTSSHSMHVMPGLNVIIISVARKGS